MHRRVTRVIIYWLLCICFLWNTMRMGADSATNAPSVITSIEQLNQLPPDKAAENLDVKFSATVLYHDVDWRVMFLQDGASGFYMTPWDMTTRYEPGDVVEVTGLSDIENGINKVYQPNLRILSHRTIPNPLKTTMRELRQNWGNWVELEGTVKSVGTNAGRLMLRVEQGGEMAQVTCLNPNPADNYFWLVDSQLRLRGVNGTDTNIKPILGQIFVPGFTNVSILVPGSTNFMRTPPVTIKSLVTSGANHPPTIRVHLQGVASDIRQNSVISLTDSTGTILVKVPNNGPLDNLEALNVWGYPVFSHGQMLIEDGIMQPVPIGTPFPRTESQAYQKNNKAPAPTLITNVKDLRGLSAEVATQKIPVRFRGVLTYYDPEWKNVFFNDNEAGVYLSLKEYPTNIASGQWVEVTGTSDPGLYAPMVTDGVLINLGITNAPTPTRASLSELRLGSLDSQWVEIKGVVCDVDTKPGHLQMEVRTLTGRFKVTVPNYTEPAPTNLIGSQVLLRGASGAVMGWDKTKLAGINLHVPSLSKQHFRILNAAPTNFFETPPVDIQSLYLYNPALISGQPVKITGRVTLIENSLDFYLQDETGGLHAQLLRPSVMQLGDMVNVVGFLTSINGTMSLTDARLQFIRSGRPVGPIPIENIEKLLYTHGYDNQLISLKARLLESVLPRDLPQLVLESGASMFIATLEKTGPNKPMPALQPGSLLELTGVCILQPGEDRRPNSFRLLLRNADDIFVVTKPPWWTPRRTLWALLIFIGLTAATMGWVWLLRSNVREKTAQIKQRMKQEEALESRYKDLFENANDLFLSFDLQGHCTGINAAAERFFGYSRQEAVAMSIPDVVVPEQMENIRDRIQSLMQGRSPESIELKVVKKNRMTAIIEVNARVFFKDGQPAGLQAIGRDVTERIQIAQELERERNLLRILIDHMPDSVFVKDENERFIITNNAYGRMRGDETPNAFIGKTVFDLFPREMAERFHRDDQLILREEKAFRDYEEQTINAEGIARWLSTTKVPLKDSQNRIIGLVGISRDITEQKEKECRLRQLSTAVEQSPASIVITDLKGNIEYVNPRFTEQTGFEYAEIRGKNMRILKPDSSQESVYLDLWMTLSAGKEWKGELQNRKASGRLFWESAHISPIKNAEGVVTHYVGVYEDITERRNLEGQLRQAQKMESVGQLAAGVAHDFNNILTVIQGHAEMLQAEPAVTPENREALDQITAAAKRAANLTRQLLLFSRKQAMQPQTLDLENLIGNLSKMLHRLLGEQIEMQTVCEAAGAVIYADPGMVEQIIVNLCVNARDAMPGGGRLSLETKVVEFPRNTPLPHAEANHGQYVRLSVSDTGHGMNEETLSRVFEPFFTTKDKGKGTGLGLATVYGIVKQHQGWIDVRSAEGKGTTFQIYFPVSEKAACPGGAQATQKPVRGGSECILVVEDEDPLRLMVSMVLKRQGYRVVCASSGVEALESWKHCSQDVDLMLTDMVMPHGITGRQLADRLLAEKPSLKVIYSSGYSVDLAEAGHKYQEGINFLPKPYRPEVLVKIVRECLDRDREPVNV